jgi:hypothetical protein
MADITFGQATQNLASSLDKIQSSLSDSINDLATKINTLADYSSTGDVSDMNGVKDGDVVKLQYAINEMEKAAESGASTFTKAEGISKQVCRTLAGA